MPSLKGFSPAAVIGIGIAIYVLAAIIPSAISSFFNASTVGWTASAVALWGIIPIVIIALLVFKFVPGKGE